MDQVKAYNKAVDLMIKHGLWQQGWNFKFDRSVRRFGCCNYSKKFISLSRQLVQMNNEDEVIDTILHEIAHALVGPGHGHDNVWKAKCREIGARPKRCYRSIDVNQPKAKYVAICPTCEKKFYKHRLRTARRNGLFHCSSCYRKDDPYASRLLYKENLTKAVF